MPTELTYFVRFRQTAKTYPAAQKQLQRHVEVRNTDPNLLSIGYYIPQPKYKSWVPTWLIKILTTK